MTTLSTNSFCEDNTISNTLAALVVSNTLQSASSCNCNSYAGIVSLMYSNESRGQFRFLQFNSNSDNSNSNSIPNPVQNP